MTALRQFSIGFTVGTFTYTVVVLRAVRSSEDVSFGIRQIVDIALRALFPGVNDPTTAHECIVHLGAVVSDIHRRELPPTPIFGEDGKWVTHVARPTYADYVSQAFDEIRQSAVALPSLASALAKTVAGIASDLQAEAGRHDE